ncbi:hypothetical protein T4A_9977 [Trichinella pseudospiralis]|uniref:Uncharacterized protein n=1 Tax=Trichinella pseudospiralis TaxID=6337 RepID=A0A0V1JTD1_TRIPS|nr:hypothetical protein T4A_9977 [Trichinella pseudospiralis]KRY88781.1 hypothetical protein T4D_16001 [Trichinella pseudospiralis]KRZ38243.1 hypothetical protein T4C_5852 [Trichinella pseudospiralis]
MHSYKMRNQIVGKNCAQQWERLVGVIFFPDQKWGRPSSSAYEEYRNAFPGGFIFIDPGMLFGSVITVMNMHPLRVSPEGRPVVNF